MGKGKKIKSAKNGPKVTLEQQIEDEQFVKPKDRVKIRERQDEDEEVRFNHH